MKIEVMGIGKHFRAVTAQSLFMVCLAASSLFSQTATNFEQRIQTIVSRPEFAHSTFGIEFYSLDTGKPIYQLNPDKLLVPGSTTKLLTEGTLLELLGADYRFHTRVYRTGSVKKGTLDGDLVLVASGDPNLPGRIHPDGRLGYENMDHSYRGPDTRRVRDPPPSLKHLAARDREKGHNGSKGG